MQLSNSQELEELVNFEKDERYSYPGLERWSWYTCLLQNIGSQYFIDLYGWQGCPESTARFIFVGERCVRYQYAVWGGLMFY